MSPWTKGSMMLALMAAAMVAPMPAQAQPSASAPPADDEDASDSRYPDYVAAGSVLLPVGAGFGVAGLAVGAAADDGTAALGLATVGTTAMAVGLPLLLLGLTPEEPTDSGAAYAGITLATPGVLSFGLGASIMMFREFGPDVDPLTGAQRGTPDRVLPIGLMVAGAAATVGGVILWATGATSEDTTVALRAGPTSLAVDGTF
ncbi:MAG: hypothetical protein AAF928_07780 [Myxococcota bacterium]